MSKVPAFVLFLSVVYLTLPDNRCLVDGTAHRHDAESSEENNATDGQKDDVKFTPLRKKHGRKKLNKNLAFSLKEFVEAMAEKKVPRKKTKGKHKNRRKHYTSAMHMKSIKGKFNKRSQRSLLIIIQSTYNINKNINKHHSVIALHSFQ